MKLRNNICKYLWGRNATVFLLVVAISSLSVINGQNKRDDVPPLRERLFFGGQLGLQFGTYTNIQVAPMVGLWVMPRIAVAIGPNYQFYKDPYYKTSLYGGNAYVQFVPLRDLNNIIPLGIHTGFFLHLEDELLSLESAVWDPQRTSNRFVINTILAGCGISQPMGGRASMNLYFLWALNNNMYGLYSNPEIRLSFSF
jgi:hypothetical protein